MHQVFTDQMGRKVTISPPPKRIISLVPSQSELLFYLGLEKELLGITKFCVHPADQCARVEKIGGTKTVKLSKIQELQPDLIIGNKEENDREQIELLARDFPVWMSDVANLSSALGMIRQLGEICQREAESRRLVAEIQEAFTTLRSDVSGRRVLRTAYLIWRKPYMVAAASTFIHEMLKDAGFENVFADRRRYPAVDPAELQAADPEVILLSSEPFPFKPRHIQEIQDICPQARVQLVDGEYFSWYGSRLLPAARYFKELNSVIHQNL